MIESRLTAGTQASRSTAAESHMKRASAAASCVLPVPPVPACADAVPVANAPASGEAVPVALVAARADAVPALVAAIGPAAAPGWAGGVSTAVSPAAGVAAGSNPVSGRGLKYSASGGTVPERTGQCSGGGRSSASRSTLTWLFMLTLGSLVSHQQGYDDTRVDKRGLARHECPDPYFE